MTLNEVVEHLADYANKGFGESDFLVQVVDDPSRYGIDSIIINENSEGSEFTLVVG